MRPAQELRGLLGALERLGFDLDALLASVGLTRARVEDADASLPANACAALFTRAQREWRVRNLPLRLAQEAPIGASPLLDYLVVTAETVGEALRRLARHLRIVNPRIDVRIRDEADPIRFVVESPDHPFEVELTVALSVLRLRLEAGERLEVAGVAFKHRPEDAAEFARILRGPLRCGATWNGWSLPRRSWELPLRRRDPALGRWIERQAERMRARAPAVHDLVADVRNVVTADLADGGLRIDFVARRLAMAPRTLQRRLAALGTSFDAVREAVRRESAECLLSDPALGIAAVALLLGYSEPSAFHRAFRRWYGTSPSEYRGIRGEARPREHGRADANPHARPRPS